MIPYADSPVIIMCDTDELGIDSSQWNYDNYVWADEASPECNSASVVVMTIGSLCNYHTVRNHKNEKHCDLYPC